MPKLTLRQFFLQGFGGLLAAAIVIATAVVAEAGAQDNFQGVWAANNAACDKVFTKKDGQVNFLSYGGYKADGLIIKGNQLNGPQATCEIVSQKEQADKLAVVLSCKTQIMFDKVVVHVRFLNDHEFVQFDPDVPGLNTPYRRCPM